MKIQRLSRASCACVSLEPGHFEETGIPILQPMVVGLVVVGLVVRRSFDRSYLVRVHHNLLVARLRNRLDHRLRSRLAVHHSRLVVHPGLGG